MPRSPKTSTRLDVAYNKSHPVHNFEFLERVQVNLQNIVDALASVADDFDPRDPAISKLRQAEKLIMDVYWTVDEDIERKLKLAEKQKAAKLKP